MTAPVVEQSSAASIELLIEAESKVFLDRQPRSTELIERGREHLAGGATSNWQIAQPQAVWMSHGAGSKVYDVDGTEYVDMHGGYGASIAGHAHPAIVAAVSDRSGAARTSPSPPRTPSGSPANWPAGSRLPLWRFANSGTEATMDAVHLMRALTGRDLIIKVEGCYHGHHDSVQVSVLPEADEVGPRDHPIGVPGNTGIPAAIRDLVVVVPFNDLVRCAGTGRAPTARSPAMILEPVMMNAGIIPPDDGYLAGHPRPAAPRRRAADLRRGQDRLHHRSGRRHRDCRASCPTSSVWQRHWAAASRSPRSAGPKR